MAQKKDAEWTARALEWLRSQEAPSAMTIADVRTACCIAAQQAVSYADVKHAVKQWESTGSLKKVRKGVWLNAEKKPAGALDDVLALARPGAVNSLHSVLGACGAHNNPSIMAFGVCPSDEPPRELPGVSTRLGQMRFFSLPEAFFEEAGAGGPWRASSKRPSFAPEKALLDWIFLGRAESCSLPEPNPSDIDLDMLDLRKAATWAKQLRMGDKLATWLSRHPEPNEQALAVVARAREEGLAVEARAALARDRKAPTMRDRARARGLAR